MACGLYIAGCSVCYIVGTFWCRRWLLRHGLAGAVKRGAAFTLAGGLSMVGLAWAGVIGPWAIVVPQFVYAFGHGIHQPCGQAAVVGPFPQHAGAASALAGFILAAAAVARGRLAGRGDERTVFPLVLTVGAMSVATALVAWTLVQRHGEARSEPPEAICLAGPTAIGKSALALQLADALRGQIEVEFISVDSAQVYRGMDIGTAKPGATERARVPHHLIDILEPEQAYSAARFVHDATAACIDDIRARGRLPLLVGGTMLYFKALRDGLDAMPAADPALRAHRRARRRRKAGRRCMPSCSASIPSPPRGWRRTMRSASSARWRCGCHRAAAVGIALAARARRRPATPDRWPLIALEPTSRAWLHERIAQRFDAMLAAGLVDEVRRLRQRPALRPDMPSMRCVGYRQAWAALDAATSTACANRHRRHAATGQAPDHLAALDGRRMPSRATGRMWSSACTAGATASLTDGRIPTS